METIKSWWEFITHFHLMMKVIFRSLMGRFFVFRDMPDKLVNSFAEMEMDGDDKFNRIVDEARQERELRKRQNAR